MAVKKSSAGFLKNAGKWVRPGLLLLFFALIITGRFDSASGYGILHFSLIAFLIVVFIFEILDSLEQKKEKPQTSFYLGLWILVAVRIALQSTGGIDSSFYPLMYLFFTVLVGVFGPVHGMVLWVAFVGLESGWVIFAGKIAEQWKDVLGHAAFLAVFGSVVGAFVHLERTGRLKAERVLDQLKSDMSEFQRDDTVHRLQGLSDAGRKKESLASVFALDTAFLTALESARGLLSASTCALYWRTGPDEPFRLREIATREEPVNTKLTIPSDEGALAFVIEQRKTVRQSGRKEIKGILPYYPASIKALHMIAAPVSEQGWVQGVLLVDRVIDEQFTRHDEKLALAISKQLIEIHSHALLMKRSEAHKSQFKSLAELGRKLSGSLKMEEILDAIIKTSRAISGQDASAIILPVKGGGHDIVLTGGEMDPGSIGNEISVQDTLVGWAIREREQLVISDILEKAKKKPVLAKKYDPSDTRSVLIHPLTLTGELTGALVMFSSQPDNFTRFIVRVTGILANMASVSILNALHYKEMQEQAITDGLTGLNNHRWFQQKLSDEIERADRIGNKVAVVLSDIDYFKKINDTYGHPIGDEVLKKTAALLKGSIRKVDSAARYGGEEFVLILVGNDGEGAMELAERIRTNISKIVHKSPEEDFRITISLGIAVYPDDASNKEKVIELADQALYHAKETGRNKSVLFSMIKN